MDMTATIPQPQAPPLKSSDVRRERLARRLDAVILKCRNSDSQPKPDLEKQNEIRDEAQARYQFAVDDFTAQAKANALAKKKKKRDEMIAVFLLLMLDAGEENYVSTYKKLETLSPTTEGRKPSKSELQKEAASFAEARQKDLAGFPDRIYGRFDDIMTEAEKEGASEKDIRARLNKAAKAVKDGEGRIVAETESQMTAGSAQLRILERAGFKNAYWISVGDEKVRDGHIENEAAGLVKLGNKFPDGCRFPGDPLAPIECTINCRCWLQGGERK